MEHNYLAHHGTPGQKWGIRKYQYEDGSLTPAGKLRYYKGDGTPTRAGKRYEKRLRKQKEEEAERERTKRIFKPSSEMTMEELQQEISKLRLEKDYNALVKEMTQSQRNKLSDRVKSAAGDALVDGIKKGGAQFLSNYMSEKGKYLGSNRAGELQVLKEQNANTKYANETKRLEQLMKERQDKRNAKREAASEKFKREEKVDYNRVEKATQLITSGKLTKSDYYRLANKLTKAESNAVKERLDAASKIKIPTQRTSNTKGSGSSSNTSSSTNKKDNSKKKKKKNDNAINIPSVNVNRPAVDIVNNSNTKEGKEFALQVIGKLFY